MLESIKTEFECNEALLEDFPASIYPIRRLERIHNRAGGQTLDGEPFLAKLEEAQVEGDTAFVAAHMPRLEQLIAHYMDRTYELAQLQYRARMIREHHEPRAEMRR